MKWRAMSWHLSACPTCGGDLYREALDDDAFTCLQCGRVFDLAQSMSLVGDTPTTAQADVGKALLGDMVDTIVERDQTAEAARFKRHRDGSRRSKAA